MNEPSFENDYQFLGDRDLALWVGLRRGGVLFYNSYSYYNLNGAGHTYQFDEILHKGRLVKWFYTYFGYSKPLNKAYVYVKWSDTEDTLTFKNTKHYYAPKFWFYAGKDKRWPSFNGQMSDVRVNLGADAYREGRDYVAPEDIFGFSTGLQRRKDLPDQDVGEVDGIIDSPFDRKEPAYEDSTDGSEVENIRQYGYGFWMRFLTTYP